MRASRSVIIVIAALMWPGWGCTAAADNDSVGSTVGVLRAAFDFDQLVHDVTAMEVVVVLPEEGCDATPIASQVADLLGSYIPEWLGPDGAGHPFSDALFVLQPGDYKVCVTPLAGDVPSEYCGAAEGLATVEASVTTEVVLISQCVGDPSGGLDVVVGLNDPPSIDQIVLSPSKFVGVCQETTFSVLASDPNGDTLAYVLEVIDHPVDALWAIDGEGAELSGQFCGIGPWILRVVVSDSHGGAALLTFPLHVSDMGWSCDPPCGDTEMCVDGACVPIPVCDPPCQPGYACIDEVCVLKTCDEPCADGQQCVLGECVTPLGDHTTYPELVGPFASGPEVTTACMACHAQKADEMLGASHWLWRGPTPGAVGHETGSDVGKNNTINNFCIAVPSNEPRCTQCHAGYGFADAGFDFTDPTHIDCLVCHDGSGQYAKDPKTAGAPAVSVDLVAAAQSVGPTSRASCGACHFFAGGGDNVKKGDIGSWAASPSGGADVHMGDGGSGGFGMTCAECHDAGGHRLAGGGLHNPVEEAPLACTDCHQGPLVHFAFNAHIDGHLPHVACETCHIPRYSRQQPTKVEWYWSAAGDADRVPVLDEHGMPDYDKMKGEFVWDMDIEPELVWFNGTFTRKVVGDGYDSVPVDLGSPLGDIDDATAKITPFKVMRGDQPVDPVNGLIAVPHLFGLQSGPHPYWVDYDWNLAIADGMVTAGLPYSGTFEFVETVMYLELHHEVRHGVGARQCIDCHDGGIDFGRLGYDGDPRYTGGQHALY